MAGLFSNIREPPGFDEFFGNLYDLDVEEEPENADLPEEPEFKKRFGPRGVLRATADGKIEGTGVGRQDRPRRLPGRHGRARRTRRAIAQEAGGSGDPWTTRSSSIRPTKGGFRVPTCIRSPGVVKPGTVVSDSRLADVGAVAQKRRLVWIRTLEVLPDRNETCRLR
jgi:arylsulfatase A-like enzyme